MASAGTGDLFVAWQDDGLGADYIQVYQSSDGGESWFPFGYVLDTSAVLRWPSIAVGEGVNGDSVLLAYIVDDGSSTPVPEVAVAPITGGPFVPTSVPVWTWEAFDRPVISTDSYTWDNWYAYLTCEGIYDSGVNNINVCTWRSTDGGFTWTDDTVLYGNFDTDAWRDPDIAYGTNLYRLFVSTYHENTASLSTCTSDNAGITWNAPVVAATLGLLPDHEVDPEIAPSILYGNVMLACTKNDGVGLGEDNIGYTYSQDGGNTWSTFWTLPGTRVYDDFAVALTANEGGENWHLAYTSAQDQTVHYSCRPQDLSDLWSSETWIVDDRGRAGSYDDRARKGIASLWATDRPVVAWADGRDQQIGDWDTYADFIGNEGLVISRHLVGQDEEADIEFLIDAGLANANRGYVIFGSFTGTEPGTPLPGGYVVLPINWDLLTLYTLTWGPPVFYRFRSRLDAAGRADARMYIPPGQGLPGGLELNFAFALTKPWDYASNAVSLHVEL